MPIAENANIFNQLNLRQSMKVEEIIELFRQFESIANEYEGDKCLGARELSSLLGYVQ